jgi:hypothetical protein
MAGCVSLLHFGAEGPKECDGGATQAASIYKSCLSFYTFWFFSSLFGGSPCWGLVSIFFFFLSLSKVHPIQRSCRFTSCSDPLSGIQKPHSLLVWSALIDVQWPKAYEQRDGSLQSSHAGRFFFFRV